MKVQSATPRLRAYWQRARAHMAVSLPMGNEQRNAAMRRSWPVHHSGTCELAKISPRLLGSFAVSISTLSSVDAEVTEQAARNKTAYGQEIFDTHRVGATRSVDRPG